MNKKIILAFIVLVLIVPSLSGCCNRCKNKPDSSIPAAAAGQEPYAASALDQSSTYTARHATK